MADKNRLSGDLLDFLRDCHTGAENRTPSVCIERIFGIDGAAVRQLVNRLRCEGQPVCSDANGYFYAKNQDEINGTIAHLLNRAKKIDHAARGLALSRQVFATERRDSR